MGNSNCILIGAPVDSGKKRQGCLMGPDALRVAGLKEVLTGLGYTVEDQGNIAPAEERPIIDSGHLYRLPETIAWTEALIPAAKTAMAQGLPVFLGGDHALSLGSVTGVAEYAAEIDRPLFVLWLDAHSDFHTPQSTDSGNLHGTPVGYLSGRAGFDAFPPVKNPVPEENICLFGIRSVDRPEVEALADRAITIHDMRDIDEHGVVAPLRAFLKRVADANGLLHVSLDADFLDPAFAPAVGTTVPGGATVREAHLVMELIHDSGLLSSLDVVELNPILDERGKTASVMVDLVASGLGRRVFDRPTASFT